MILVTGGSGMTGSYLIKKLVSEGHKVRSLIHRNKPQSLDPAIKDLVEWKQCDILNLSELDEAFEDVDHVYHCAAMVSFQPKDKDRMMEINIEGTANIVNYCLHHGVSKMVHMSSIAALGRDPKEKVLNEGTQWKETSSNSSYAVSKYLSELEVWRGVAEGLNAVIVNPGVILGTGDWSDNTARMWPIIEKGVSYYPTGKNGFVDVRDVVDIMYELMESDISEERFVLTSENVMYQDLLATIAKNLKAKEPNKPLTRFKANIAWRFFAFLKLITGMKPMFTKEHTAFMLGQYNYDSTKVKESLDREFRPVDETIKDISELYLNKESGTPMLP